VAIIKRIAELSSLKGYDADALAAAADNPYVQLLAVESALSDEHGDFAIFAVWHRKDSCGVSSDVVVAAPWIDAHSRRGVEHVAAAIQATLGNRIQAVSGIFALDVHHPILTQLTSHFNVTKHSAISFKDCVINGIDIDDAMIFALQKM
jgi:hypothetical protein